MFVRDWDWCEDMCVKIAQILIKNLSKKPSIFFSEFFFLKIIFIGKMTEIWIMKKNEF
jgi:hypothetical protein